MVADSELVVGEQYFDAEVVEARGDAEDGADLGLGVVAAEFEEGQAGDGEVGFVLFLLDYARRAGDAAVDFAVDVEEEMSDFVEEGVLAEFGFETLAETGDAESFGAVHLGEGFDAPGEFEVPVDPYVEGIVEGLGRDWVIQGLVKPVGLYQFVKQLVVWPVGKGYAWISFEESHCEFALFVSYRSGFYPAATKLQRCRG